MDSSHVSRMLQKLTERLQKNDRYEEFCNNFRKSSTNTDRIAYLYNLPETIELFPIQENFKCKSKRDAEILRSQGNNLFKVGKYSAAVKMYSQSILKAPDDSDNLALAYNNRSTANFYLKNYAMSLQDIELAFQHKYPEKNHHKLYQRRGRCLYYTCHREAAMEAFEKTIAVLDKSDMDGESRTKLITDMNKAIELCSTIKGSPIDLSVSSYNCSHRGIPEFSVATNKEAPCLSGAVEIKLDKYGGRGLFANRNIDAGEVLVVETPFSSALLKDFNLTHCHNCCNRVFLPLPCKQCSGVVFCSLACKENAWKKFHWAECCILESLQDTKGDLSLLATRMILTAGCADLLQIEESVTDVGASRTAGFNISGIYSSQDYKSAFSLVNHADKRTFKDLLSRSLSAFYYLKQIEFAGFFSSLDINSEKNSQGKPSECESSSFSDYKCLVGGHILRNIMMLPCNAHEVSEFSLNRANPAMSSTTEVAAAIYPALSLINHSCDPSVVRHSYGNICVARAIRNISSGEELKDNYGALYPTMGLETRQTHLSSQYYFTCSCETCLANWPEYMDIPCERPIFKCSKCSGQVPIPASNLTERAKCKKCKRSQDITQTLLVMGKMEESYKETLSSVIDGNISQENVDILLAYLRYVEKNVHRPWRDINDCQEAYKQCLNIQANCFPLQS